MDLTVLHIAIDAADRFRAAGRRVPVIYDAIENWSGLPSEDWGSPRLYQAFLSLEREYAPLADGVITVGAAIADLLKQKYALPVRPTIVPNTPVLQPLNLTRPTVRDVAGVDPGTPLMVYAGIVTEARGLSFLVRALKELPEVHLAIVAVPWPSAAADNLEEIAAQAGVEKRLHVVPPVDPEHIIPFLSGATIGVHPLTTEAANHNMMLPNKVFEYAHAGLRLVVSDVQAMGELVRAYRLGEVFRYGDIADFTGAVRRVLAMRNGSYLEGEDLESWRVKFSWEASEPELARLYEKVLGTHLEVDTDRFPSLEEVREGPGD
jgi:glycosyltransferase involved in cell wall biosynthesis